MFQWEQVQSVQARRFNLSEIAVELFTVDGRAYFFNVYSKQQELLEFIASSKSNVQVVKNRQNNLQQQNLTQKWQDGLISNYEYLMQLNICSGRTFNDINQYPVFPWVLDDYKSAELDLNRPETFRDLTKPVGALDDKRLKILQERSQYIRTEGYDEYLYGSHYSTSGHVLYYLLRLEPFSTLAMDLQSGKFDHADRLFSSIAATWRSCHDNTSDVKELIPEFFYLPEIFKNTANIDFGRQN